MIEHVTFTDAAHTTCNAVIDGISWTGIRLDSDTGQAKAVADWIAAGNVPEPYVAPPAPIPPISKAQALLWLRTIGKSEADVEAAIAAIPDADARAVAEIEWKYREPFHRAHPLFDQLGAALGLSSAQIDDAFRTAALL